jgi:diguanylate cyclase (GGDEF)-like protein
MSSDDLQTSFSFDDQRSGGMDAVAASIATYATEDQRAGGVVIVLRPESDRPQVVAGGEVSALRAAVSVAVAGGNHRLWETAPEQDTTTIAVNTLPEVVRAAAEGAGVVDVHVGVVREAGALRCAAMWFETPAGVVPAAERRSALQLLAGASGRDLVREQAEAEEAAARATEREAAAAAEAARVAESLVLTIDPDDPTQNPMTGLANRETFDEILDDFDGDEAVLMLVGVDGFDELTDTYGDEVGRQVLRAIASRLNATSRGTDVVAHLDTDRFGILFGNANRGAAMAIAKRVQAETAEPVDTIDGPISVSVTIGFGHQESPLDLEELFESSEHALESGRRSGRGKLVLAS